MIVQLYDNLEVIDASQPDWQDRVFDALGSKEPHTLKPLKATLDLAGGLDVRTVVLEDEYVDADFADEYRSHYSRQFTVCAPRCKRIHFFGTKFAKEALPNLDLAKQQYLGFSVVRPIRSFCTGRTVIRSPKHDGDSAYTLCRANFDANLSGNSLVVRGMPFIQQDTNVGVCAQAALWMIGRYMHQKLRFPCLHPSEITMAATRFLTIGPVRRGLAPEQVLAALREMGYAPLIFTHYDPDITARLIYAYVESELPVILLVQVGTEGHAVVVIGHDYHRRRRPSASWNSNIYWIDHFYIHDDAEGPYGNLALRRGTTAPQHAPYSVEEHARYVIVPVPPTVTMQANDVFDQLPTLMDHLNDLVDHFGRPAEPFRFSAVELTGLVFRTYLRPSNDFKCNIPAGMSEFFRHRYRSMKMPHYVWVTEIAKKEHLNKTRSKNRKIIGEIIIDSTADRHAHITSFLAIHLLGRMIVRRPGEDRPYALYIDPSEQPYCHLVRE